VPPASKLSPQPDVESEAPALSLGHEGGALSRIFAANGLLARALPSTGRDFEDRPEQREMAQAVARAIDERAHLLIEAGTGTGKSYAYLIPFILWAVHERKKVLIATHTKALQQQLVERDLPFLRNLFRSKLGVEFRSALCLGTQNYLCPRRLAKAQTVGLFASKNEVDELKEIHSFAAKTKTGRSIDLPFEPSSQLWAQVNRESDLCMGRGCSLYDDSFFYKARREQERAHILVANHHLLFAHLAAGGNSAGAVLPAFDALVIDEAHQAEDVASAYLGMEVTNLGVARLLEILHHRRSGKTPISGAKFPDKDEHNLLERKLVESVDEARVATGQFFENLQIVLNLEVSRSQTIRVRKPIPIENSLDEPLNRLEKTILEARKLAERIPDEALMRELEGFGSRCSQMRSTLNEVLTQARQNHVYWIGIQPRPAERGQATRVPRLSLNGAPIDIATAMQETVWKQIRPVVMTSATMTSGGSFEFLRSRLGLDETSERPVHTLTLGSPFDYATNALLYVTKDMPDPSQAQAYEAAAIKRAADVVKRTQGRAFVLCTSFRMVDATAQALREALPKKIKVLVQGEGARGKLLDAFRKDVSSVLVGTTSFWQGVDVPGESLSCVVLMKLPFAVPDEPLVQARVEKLRERGHNPFEEYQVPQAVMMFRQGFGRLIRTKNDRGIVAIMDPRVLTKRYGQTFLASLPDCRVTEDLDEMEAFANRVETAEEE
jgi:ATP-dependent DNA helicase DinG